MKILKNFKLSGAMLGLTVLLTACPGGGDGGVTPPPPVTPSPVVQPGTALDAGRVQGTVAGWTYGAGELTFYLPESKKYVDASTLQISAAGRLNTALPVPTMLGSYLDNCKLPAGAVGIDFQAEFAIPLAYSATNDFLGEITETTTTGLAVERVYTPSAATLKGIATCSATTKLDLDFTVAAGWNALTTVRTVAGGVTTFTVRNIASDSRMQLALDKADEEVTVIFPNPTLPTLRPGQSATLPAVLLQTGAISGAVTLETDVLGVTITPGALNLAPLSVSSAGRSSLAAAALQPQRLQTNLTFNVAADAQGFDGTLNVIVKRGGVMVGKEPLRVTIIGPTFGLGLDFSQPRLIDTYVNEPASFAIYLRQIEGFSAPVNITLEGAPAGITIAPTAALSGKVTIPLTVGDNVAPGIYPVTIVGTSGKLVEKTTVDIKVNPRRSPLGLGLVSSLALAPNGDLWGVQSGSTGSSLIQIRAEHVINRIPVGNFMAPTFVHIGPEGSIWLRNRSLSSDDSKLYRLTDSGLQGFVIGGETSNSSPQFAVDISGRAWFMWINYLNVPELRRLDPETGQIISITTVKSASSAVPVINDGTGRFVVFPASDGTFVRVDTVTGESVASVDRLYFAGNGMENLRFLTLDRQGNIWAAISGPRASLKRLELTAMNAAQNVDIVAVTDVGGGYSHGVAVEDNQTAWLTSQHTLIRLDLVTKATTITTLDSGADDMHSLSLAPTAGAAYTYGAQSSQPTPEYLRLKN